MRAAMSLRELISLVTKREDASVGTGVSLQEIDRAQAGLGVTFPPELREYLSALGQLSVGHLDFYGLGPSVPRYLLLDAMTLVERHESECPLPHGLVPLQNDGAGNLYCIDTSAKTLGRIVFWDHEGGVKQKPEVVASSLGAWLLERLRTAMTNEELEAIEARAQAASPAPWRSFLAGRDHTSGSSFIMTGEGAARGADIELSGATAADFDFIAHARQDIPLLVAEVRALRARLHRAR